MRAINNTVSEIVARYARNRHRAEFVSRNPGIPEEVLAVVYFRRATNGKWWYAPNIKFNPNGGSTIPHWIDPAPLDAPWYEIPVDPEKVKTITQETREKYMELMLQQEKELRKILIKC